MTFKKITLYFVLFFCFTMKISAISVSLEAESQTDKTYMEMYRSGASGEKAVHLFKGDRLNLEYCLTSETLVQLKDIKYSNDGGSDKLSIAMDNEPIGDFQTLASSDGGKGWNTFRSWSNFTFSKVLHGGRHRISISVTESDNFGVEVDMVYMVMPDSNQDIDSFSCKIFCFDDIHFQDEMSQNTITQMSAKIVQRSVKTQCAEEDNVNVPIFHESARKFIVTASYPKYMSFLNNRGPDWKNCRTMSGPFWKFSDFNILADTMDVQHSTARLSGNWTNNVRTLEVEFSLEGQSIGSTDSEIGTDIYLKLESLPEDVNISVSLFYLNRRSNLVNSKKIWLNSSNLNAKWTTSDFTFKEGGGNKIEMKLWAVPSTLNRINVKEFYMFKRNIAPDKSTTLYDDGMTIIEGVDMDMWWRINETMTVMLTNGNMFGNVDYLRIYQRVPWSQNGFSQVFVMYQDGNVRLLPMTPHGLDWVPFGSSVLLGQSDPHSNRPAAPVAHINVNPFNLNLKIFYVDGGFVSVDIKPKITQTLLSVSEAEYRKNLKLYPFFTFRSMWVADGNADVDHVTVDGGVTEGILSDWKELYGTFVAFHRKCISTHNTLSPDISLKIIN